MATTSSSCFLSRLLDCDGRDDATLVLPDVDAADFAKLVHLLYGERTPEETGYPSADLLEVRRNF